MKIFKICSIVIGICIILCAAHSQVKAQSDLLDMEVDDNLMAKPKFVTRFSVKLSQEHINYKEHGSLKNADSDWSAWLTRGDVIATIYNQTDTGKDMGLEFDYGLFRSTTEDETWSIEDTYIISGETYYVTDKENETNLTGWELKVGFGLLHDFEGPWSMKHLVFYGHRVLKFDRKRVVLTHDEDVAYGTSDIKNEFSYQQLDYIGYSPQLMSDWNKDWMFLIKPSAAYIVNSQAHVQDFTGVDDDIDGQGGLIMGLEVEAGYRLTENFLAHVSALGEWQYVEGNESEKAEWADNDLFTYGISVGLSFGLK